MSKYPYRSASFVITFFSTVFNCVLALQILSLWHSLKWETEAEYESSGDRWRFNGVRMIWITCSTYFMVSAAVSCIGFAGVVKSKSSLVRFYRDFSVGDFAFTVFFTALAVYGAFQTSTRANVCEELSRQPELMRDLAEMGLNTENCERWFERAVMAFVLASLLIIVARLHFLLAVSQYYVHLCRQSDQRSPASPRTRSGYTRIYMIPPIEDEEQAAVVYAPVPLNELPADVRQGAMEAWVKPGYDSRLPSQIYLPLKPDEPLLPDFYKQ